jgi:Rhodanese-like domain
MLSFLFSYPTIQKADFEDIKYAIQKPTSAILINTLPSHEQDTLIQFTIHSSEEEKTINDLLNSYTYDPNEISIIVYGKNANDPTIEKKYYQLKKLGFLRVYVYYGGMFEWALLNELYGADEFPTTQKIRDILKFKSSHSAIISKYKMLKY